MTSVTNVSAGLFYNVAGFAEVISVMWLPQTDCSNIMGNEIIINGKCYIDATTGYSIWPNVVTGVPCDASQFGGFAPGKLFTIYIKSIGKDGSEIDSAVIYLTVPNLTINPIVPAVQNPYKKKK